MIRKTAIATVAVAALALGTASATSLGTFDDVAFAASDVDLLDCELADNAIALIPDLPSVTDVTDITDNPTEFLGTLTARIGEIQVDLSSLARTCVDDEVFTLIMTSVDDVLATVELSGATLTAAWDGVGKVLTIDADSLVTLTDLTAVPDIASVTQVRMVLSDTLPVPAT